MATRNFFDFLSSFLLEHKARKKCRHVSKFGKIFSQYLGAFSLILWHINNRSKKNNKLKLKEDIFMQGMQKKVLWCVLGFFILGLIACVYWLSPDSKNTSAQMSESKAQNLASSPHTDHSSLNEDAYHSKSQQDTEVNCQLKIDSSQHLVVNSQTRDCFEYFITQYGENDLEQIKIHFGKFIQGQYLEPARSQIMDLWTRYLKYREQLAQIQAPSAKQQDKNYFQKIFNSIQDIRKRFFFGL